MPIVQRGREDEERKKKRKGEREKENTLQIVKNYMKFMNCY